MKKTSITIEGMGSLECGLKILRELSRIPKVKMARVTLNRAMVEHKDVNTDLLLKAIETAGQYRGRVTRSQRI